MSLTIDQAIVELEKASCGYLQENILLSTQGLTQDTIEQTRKTLTEAAFAEFPDLTRQELDISAHMRSRFWIFFFFEVQSLVREKYSTLLSPKQHALYETIEQLFSYSGSSCINRTFYATVFLIFFFIEKKIVTLAQIFQDSRTASTHNLLNSMQFAEEDQKEAEKELERIEKLLEETPEEIYTCDFATLETEIDSKLEYLYDVYGCFPRDCPKEQIEKQKTLFKKKDAVLKFRDMRDKCAKQKEKVQEVSLAVLEVNGAKYCWQVPRAYMA